MDLLQCHLLASFSHIKQTSHANIIHSWILCCLMNQLFFFYIKLWKNLKQSNVFDACHSKCLYSMSTRVSLRPWAFFQLLNVLSFHLKWAVLPEASTLNETVKCISHALFPQLTLWCCGCHSHCPSDPKSRSSLLTPTSHYTACTGDHIMPKSQQFHVFHHYTRQG